MARKDKVKRAIGDLLGEQEPETSGPETTAQAVTSEPRAEPSGPPNFPFSTGNIQSAGVGLRKGELALLETMAREWGVKRNFATRWVVICGLRQYLAGTLPEPPRKLPEPERPAS